MRSISILGLVAAVAAAVGFMSCSAVNAPEGPGGTGAAGGGATTSTPAGGGGGVPECETASHCPAPQTPCLTAICVDGVCGTQAVPANTPTGSQTPADCRQSVCDGAGVMTEVNDDTDLPDDGNDCTDDVCASGVPSNPALPEGTPCGQAGDLMCDANGSCIGCLQPDDCAGEDGECQWRTCDNGVCGMEFAPQGTELAQQTDGDCRVAVCDGAGHETLANDDADVSDDGNECTDDLCTNGIPSNPPLSAGSPCSQGGGVMCNGIGVCVECVSAGDCPPVANGSPACQNGTCGIGSCNPGWDDCLPGANGCETNTDTDPVHCGGCNSPCGGQTPNCVNGSCVGCPPIIGNLTLAGPLQLHGFCWYLSHIGNTCDAVCASLNGSNLSNSAANAWPDSCSGPPSAQDVTTAFYNNGNPAGWSGPYNGGIGYKTLGIGYQNSPTWFAGKCASGSSMGCGTFPGDTINHPNRNLVCPCF